tara:strand:+ start:18996 stop:20183 length:1188 start_codon:yes stop_codon:yes gene_type:complete
MKKVLVIVNAEKISANNNGGGAFIYSHLDLLHKAKCEIILLAVQWNHMYLFKEDDYIEVLPLVNEIITYKVESIKPTKGIKRLYHSIFNPTKFEYHFINKYNSTNLQKIVNDYKIDLVWAEWRWAAILAMETKLDIPKIYSHHDWEYKLALLRAKPNLNKKFHTFQKKRVEMKMVKTMDACISGSFTETQEIKTISKKQPLYLPTTYDLVNINLKPNTYPFLVHLGGMGTTANRLGLERFLDVCWNDIKKEIPNIQLKVIGNLKNAQISLKHKLEDPQIIKVGFVKDLSTELYPEDMHIIPWEYNTGTRTRVPVILNYQQVLVTTTEAVKCFPEINNKNAILCKDLKEMKDVIIDLYSDREKLHLLATSGKKTFQETFTSESQIKSLQDFLKKIH